MKNTRKTRSKTSKMYQSTELKGLVVVYLVFSSFEEVNQRLGFLLNRVVPI